MTRCPLTFCFFSSSSSDAPAEMCNVNFDFVNKYKMALCERRRDRIHGHATRLSLQLRFSCVVLRSLSPATRFISHKIHSRSNQSSCLGFKAQVMITRLASIMSRSLLLNGAAYKRDMMEILDIEPWRAVKAKVNWTTPFQVGELRRWEVFGWLKSVKWRLQFWHGAGLAFRLKPVF